MKRLRKKMTAILAFALTIFYSMTISSYAILDQSNYNISLGNGIILKKIYQLYDGGTQSINIVSIDLSVPELKMELLYNQNGLPKKAKLSDMVAQDPDIVAAINADFFSTSGQSFALGPMIKNGKEISSAYYNPNVFATFLIDSQRSALIKYVQSGTYLKNITKGDTTTANSINKPGDSTKSVTVYTSEYRPNTLGSNPTRPNLVEVIVDGGTVTDVRVGQAATAIPTTGFAILADPSSGKDLAQRFSVGDMVELKTEITLNHQDIQTAVGGGSILIKDGAPATITKKVGGKSQRTAIAITNDNKILLVTADGRGIGGVIGMSEADMQSFLQAQNVKDAMMLDGGGSTEMIVDKKIQNAVASERALINGIGVKNTTPKTSAAKVEVVPLRDVFIQGDKVPLSLKTMDTNDNLILGSSFNVSSQGVSGSFDGKNFVFTSGGEGQIIANSGGVQGTTDVKVIGISDIATNYKESLQSPSITVLTNTHVASEDVMFKAIRAKAIEVASAGQTVIQAGSSDADLKSNLRNNVIALNGAGTTNSFNNTKLIMLSAGGGQWSQLQSALQDPSQNLVIFVNGTMKFSEANYNYFKKSVHTASESKNIYIVEKSNSYKSWQEGKISRITVTDLNSIQNDLSQYKCLVMSESEGKLIYSFKSLF